jgi:hypothetical protein
MLAATCPASTEAPATSMDRKRSMIPPVMSLLTVTAVIEAPNPALSSSTPGTTFAEDAGGQDGADADQVDQPGAADCHQLGELFG